MPLPTSQLVSIAVQHFSAGRFSDAASVARKALAADPDNADALQLLGVASYQTGSAADAIPHLARAALLRPDDAGCLNNLGQAFRATGEYPQAEACFRRVLASDPSHALALINLSLTLTRASKLTEATDLARRAVDLRPDLAAAHAALADALADTDPDAAMDAYRQSLELAPDQPDVLNNAGNLLLRRGEIDDAIEAFTRALKLNSRFPQALNNLGVAYTRLNKLDASLRAFEQAIALANHDVPAHVNHAKVLLTLGDYDRGWREYEWRWATPADRGVNPRIITTPLPPTTENTDLTGKTVTVYTEQGLGDILHFIRYVPLLARKGARVTLAEVPTPLVSVLGSVEGVTEVIPTNRQSAIGNRQSDFQANLLTLPLLFRTTVDTIPAEVPYLGPSPDKIATWRDRLANDRNLKVGLRWAGDPRHANDALRSIDPTHLAPLFNLPNVSWYSLQTDATTHPAHPLIDHTADLHDFEDTAALVVNLDLVVTVDTAVAHLAGALAKDTFVLLPLGPEFRWLTDRSDSPWYPTAHLFRQTTFNDWAPVITAVASAVADRRR